MSQGKVETSENSIVRFNQDLTSTLAGLYLPIIEKYHRAEYRGLENIPTDMPFVSVGNHGGVHFMPEALLWITKYQSEKRPIPMLTLTNKKLHNIARIFKLPINELGFLDESPESALMALGSGYAVATYPGGDQDISKPFLERNKIEFFGNVGYVRAAIASQKPIVPVVGCGGGETIFTVSSGEEFAKKFRLGKFFGIKSWPVFWSFPRGMHAGHMPHFSVPVPSKIVISVLPPILTQGYDTSEADNPETVLELDEMVRSLMQKELDQIAEGRIPIIG